MFSKAMKYYGANLCVKASTNIDTNNIFQFLTIFVQNLTILPQIEKSWTIQLCSTANIFLLGYKVQQSNLSANAPTNMDADNISDFSRFLYRIWIFCPKIANSWPIQIWSIQPMFSVMLWSTTVQTFVPIHQQI